MFASYRNRWWIVVACTFGLMVVEGPINLFGFAVFLKPVSEELHISRSNLASGFFLSSILCGIMVPLVGLLVDRWGSRRILLPGVPLFSLSIALFAMLRHSVVIIYALFALTGLFGAAQNAMPYTKVLSGWFDRERGVVLGIALAGVGLGMAIVPQMLKPIIENFGWRMAYLCLGAIVMLFAFFPVLIFVREPAPGDLPDDSSHSVGAKRNEMPGLTVAEVFGGQWRFWFMSIGFFLAVVSINGALGHLVVMLSDRGLSSGQATAALSVAGLGVVLGRVVCGWCLDRFHGPCVAVCFFILPAVGIAGLAGAVDGITPTVGGGLCGVGLGAHLALMAYFVTRYFGLKAYGKVFGTMFGLFLIGSGMGPYLYGLSFDLLHSYRPVLIASAVCLVAVSLLFAPLGRYRFIPGKAGPEAKLVALGLLANLGPHSRRLRT